MIRPTYLHNLNNVLIKYIYDTIDVSRFKYEMLKYDNQLPSILTTTYFAPNYSGKNCFLVFTKINTHYYSFIVDKRQLSYTYDKVVPTDIFISHCNVNVDMAIYLGTIFDGQLIKQNNNSIFMISDVYYLKGSDCTNNNLSHKMLELELYLDNMNTQIIKNKINSKNNIKLQINKIYKLEFLKSFIKNDLNNDEHLIKGICFYPHISGVKLIFMLPNYNMQQKNFNKHKFVNKQITQYNDQNFQKSKNIVKNVFVAKNDSPVYAILEMQTTKTADNYKLFALEKLNDTKFKKCQMDIAYIPNMQKSQWCIDITNDSPTGCVFVKCIWRNDKKKWEPLCVQPDVKLPSLIDDIRKHIIEIEQSESDTDEI